MDKAQLKKEIKILNELGLLNRTKAGKSFFKTCSDKYISSIGQCCHNITQNGFNFDKKTSVKVKQKLSPIKKALEIWLTKLYQFLRKEKF